MIVKNGFFHADPHPGNLMVLPGPKLVLIDFGQAKELEPAFKDVLVRFTRTLLDGDNVAMGSAFRDLGFRTKRMTPRATSSSATRTSAAWRSGCRRRTQAGPKARSSGVVPERDQDPCARTS